LGNFRRFIFEESKTKRMIGRMQTTKAKQTCKQNKRWILIGHVMDC
jgi:hypothetical protein